MGAFAAEIGFSETTDVESREPPYEVRIFTPEAEIPFAGHPTLGTAHVLRERVADGRLDEVRERDGAEALWMTQQPPEFGETLPAEDAAAGSSNGCLAAYLARHAYFGGGTVDARVEQGYE